MSDNRLPFSMVVQPWYKDHAVGGKIVLPAVETMLLLASRCLSVDPERNVRVMEDVRFGKFLEIPGEASAVSTLFEWAEDSKGRLQMKLLSHTKIGTMSRIKEHCELFFPATQTAWHPPSDVGQTPLPDPVKKIEAGYLYRHLVPFGRLYQTLQDVLYLSKDEAWGVVKAPLLPHTDPVQAVLGSPFPLDGALHAACVLGQQSVDFPPFPVGFKNRTVFRPTEPGKEYLTRVKMTSLTPGELVFDLKIFSRAGQPCESVRGISMRDVSKALTKTSGP